MLAGYAAEPRRQAVAGTAVRGLCRFATARGLPASREFLLDYDVIEAFCVAGLPGRASSARGTYRPALYRLARSVHGEPGQRATPFAGAKAPPPYPAAERAEVAAIAAGQRDPVNRASALAMVVFGIGAGLRPGELVALRGSDVTRHRPACGSACQRPGGAGGAGRIALCRAGGQAGRRSRDRLPVPARPGGPGLQELRHQLRPDPGGRCRPRPS